MTRFSYNARLHAYWYGPRCKNVTNVAKFGEDTGRLDAWNRRNVLVGVAYKPALLEKVRVSLEDNGALDAIAEEAIAEAGAHEGRDRGVVLHSALEAFDLGKRVILSDLTSAAIANWEHVLDRMKWEVRYVERCVVWPKEKIAGRFDRIVEGPMCPDCGATLFIVDYKGGARVLEYPKAIAAQLALYTGAELLIGEFDVINDKGFTEESEPMPQCCTCWGYIVHMPADAEPQLIRVNLREGARVVNEILIPIIEWRSLPNEQLAELVPLGDEPTLEDMFAVPTPEPDPFAGLPKEEIHADSMLEDRQANVDTQGSDADQGLDAPKPARASESLQVQVLQDVACGEQLPQAKESLANLTRRLAWLKANARQQASVLAAQWPFDGVKVDDLDYTQTLTILTLLQPLEAAAEAPFDPFVPTPVQPQQATTPLSGTMDPASARTPDEGPDMAPGDIAAMSAHHLEMPLDHRQRIQEWAAEANRAGTPFSLKQKPSKRRFSIARVCFAAVEHHEDVVRAALSLALGFEVQPVMTTGSALGALTQQEAETCWEILLSVGGSYRWDGKGLVAA